MRKLRGTSLGAVLLIGLSAGGCARPQGVLFPVIDPPRIWPEPPDPPAIRLLGTLSDSGDLQAGQSGAEVFQAALRGSRPPIRLVGPQAIAVREDDVLAVADGQGGAVHLIDLVHRTHTMVTGWGDERLGVPLGVTWVGNRLFVTDARRHEVIEANDRGEVLRQFGSDVLTRPVGIACLPGGDDLYVVDGGAHCVVRFDRTGREVGRWGKPGSGPGELNFPTHLAVDGTGRIAVADSGNFRVQLFDTDGNYVSSFGSKGDAAGNFALPKGVGFDRAGHVYVVDAQFENVQIFDAQGRLLLAFGEEGNGLGQFSLPAGLTIDHHNRIWVADSGNRRLQVFAYVRDS
ncbi:MAG TPA: 6-bladed beta-propeller [Phycisphaerae bacterium]|nr:6-bladed beta-propeller [Phycisphaerae bacterium]HNU45307.1 6-bladed beta-propeller [Phycisphaerae bacterium]